MSIFYGIYSISWTKNPYLNDLVYITLWNAISMNQNLKKLGSNLNELKDLRREKFQLINSIKIVNYQQYFTNLLVQCCSYKFGEFVPCLSFFASRQSEVSTNKNQSNKTALGVNNVFRDLGMCRLVNRYLIFPLFF